MSIKTALGAAILAAAISPALAGSTDHQDGAVAALVVNYLCPSVNISDERLGMFAYLAAAEAGRDVERMAPELAAKAVLQAKALQRTNSVAIFCEIAQTHLGR